MLDFGYNYPVLVFAPKCSLREPKEGLALTGKSECSYTMTVHSDDRFAKNSRVSTVSDVPVMHRHAGRL